MSTSIKSKTNQQYVDFDEYIEYQLTKTRSNIKTTDVLTALAGVAVLVLGYVLVFVVFDHWIITGGFSRTTRIFMLGAVVIAAAIWIGWKVAIPYMKRVTGLYAAREIERSSPELKSTLLNLVDLQRSGRKISEEIQTSLEKRAAVALSHMSVEEVVDRRPLMQMSYALLAVVVLWCGYSLFSPKKISNSVWRAILPAADVEVSTQTEILEVIPGDVEVLARSQLKVTADIDYKGDDLQDVRLYYSTADGRFIDEPIEMRADEDIRKRYQCVITGENGRGILQDLTYRIESGDARTRDFQVTVVQPPSATVDEVIYEYPPYMELQPKTQRGGHIDTWEGTKVRISATANMPVTAARLLFSDTEDISQRAEELPMQIVDGTQLTVTLDREIRFRSDGSYPRYFRIECRNERRQTTLDPTLYSVKIRPDKRPLVELLDPVRDLERPANAVVPLLIRAHDPDFKLKSVTLRMEKNGERLPNSIPLFDGNRKSYATTYRWQLNRPEFNFKTGDTVTYWIEARDNKTPTGNRSNTRRMKIDIIPPASEEEVREQLKQDEQRQQDKIEELRQQSNQDNEQQPPDQQDSKDGGSEDSPQPGEQSQEKNQQEGDKQKGSTHKPDGNKGQENRSEQQQQPGEGGEGEQQSFDPGGADDEAVTRKLLERFEKERQKQQPQQENKQLPGDNPPDAPLQEKSQAPNAPQQGEKGGGNEKQSNNAAGKTGPSDDKSNRDPQGEQGTEGEPDKDSTPDKNDKKQSGKGSKDSDPNPDNNNPDKNKKSADQPANGEETPADNVKNPQQQKATGNEKGTGTPDKDQKSKSTPVKDNNQIQRKPGENSSLKKNKGSEKSQKPADLKDKTKKGNPNAAGESSKNPKQTDPKQKTSPNKPDNIKRDPTQPTESPQKNVPEVIKKPDLPQGNEDLKSPNRPQGQTDKTQQGGEGGSNKPSDQGNAGSKKSGGGDSSGKQGNSQQSKQSSGQSGGSQGKGSPSANNQQGNNQSQGGKQSDGKGDGGKSGGKGSSKSGGSKGSGQGKAGGKGVGGSGNKGSSGQLGGGGSQQPGSGSGGGGASGSSQGGQGTSGGTGEESSDDAHAEYAKKAANLVLNRLENEQKRGNVDKDLLKELGWTKNDLKKFTERLRQNLSEDNNGETPQSKARKLQFQEWLKSLDLKSTGRKRTTKDRPRRSLKSIQGRRTPPPAEYRELFEAYTRGLNKRTKQKK